MKTLKNGMVLAAGLGLRMRPLTDKLPKPLVTMHGRTLLDHAIDRLAEAGVRRVVVNTHYLGHLVTRHIEQRGTPEIVISDETDALLETGGGVKKALGLLGKAPFFVANADALWLNGYENACARMARQWNPDCMDALLLLHSTVTAYGYAGRGDFLIDPLGLVTRRPEMVVSPWLFTGLQILHPRLFKGAPDGPFSLNLLYDRAIEKNRLYGIVHDGEWFHIGTPEGLIRAETFLDDSYPGRVRR